MQAYQGSYSSVTYSGNIRNEIGVMRFPCNEIAMVSCPDHTSRSHEAEVWSQNLALTVPKSAHANDLSLEIMYVWSRVCTALETVGRAPVFVWERCLAWSFSRWSDSSACSARTQGAMKTGPAPDESAVSVRSDNTYIMGIRFGAMGFVWVNSCWHISRTLQAIA